MIANSVAHAYVQKQQSSWIDDPFQLGTFAVKGVTKMRSHKQNLASYAEELIANYAKFINEQYELTLDMLPEDEHNELVRLYVESIDREIEYACYGSDESINSSYLCALLAMLKNDCPETRDTFAEVTRKNMLTYYELSLQEMLDEAAISYHHMINNEQGLYAQQDQDTGEVYWGRF